MNASDQRDHNSATPDDVARSVENLEPPDAAPDPRDTSHPTGDAQAQRNIDDEPAG